MSNIGPKWSYIYGSTARPKNAPKCLKMAKNGPKWPKNAQKWPIFANFQWLELSAQKLPMIGTFPEKTSNGWNFFAPVPA
ncbi:MAG: hypothetical protein AB7T27_00275 [Kiritimatiellia bacterium]